jgi:hypothetical protein
MLPLLDVHPITRCIFLESPDPTTAVTSFWKAYPMSALMRPTSSSPPRNPCAVKAHCQHAHRLRANCEWPMLSTCSERNKCDIAARPDASTHGREQGTRGSGGAAAARGRCVACHKLCKAPHPPLVVGCMPLMLCAAAPRLHDMWAMGLWIVSVHGNFGFGRACNMLRYLMNGMPQPASWSLPWQRVVPTIRSSSMYWLVLPQYIMIDRGSLSRAVVWGRSNHPAACRCGCVLGPFVDGLPVWPFCIPCNCTAQHAALVFCQTCSVGQALDCLPALGTSGLIQGIGW